MYIMRGQIKFGRGRDLPGDVIVGYRGTSLIRNRHPVGPYSRNMPRLL